MEDRQPRLAERWLTLACEKAAPGEILESLLAISLRRNPLDDHYFLYPVYAYRALDVIGWQWGPILLRPVVRFLARHHPFDAFDEFDQETLSECIRYHDRYGELEALIEEHELIESKIGMRTGPAETAAIETLAARIGEVNHIASLPRIIARAMGQGLSLAGALSALSIGGGRLFLRSHTGNPYDVHIHTGTAARRYVLGFEEVSFKHKVIALLGWAWGFEVRYLDKTLKWTWQSHSDDLSRDSAEDLLAEIEGRMLAIDGHDLTQLTVDVSLLVSPREIREITRLAESYVKAGYDIEALFALTARLVCREDASEMHGYKLQQAAYDEYARAPEPLRWVHAAAAVKQAAVNVSTKPVRVYPQIAAALDLARRLGNGPF